MNSSETESGHPPKHFILKAPPAKEVEKENKNYNQNFLPNPRMQT